MLDHSPKMRPTATSLINLDDEGLEENVDFVEDGFESDYISEYDPECQNDSV